jgi:hypothetical protein
MMQDVIEKVLKVLQGQVINWEDEVEDQRMDRNLKVNLHNLVIIE